MRMRTARLDLKKGSGNKKSRMEKEWKGKLYCVVCTASDKDSYNHGWYNLSWHSANIS